MLTTVESFSRIVEKNRNINPNRIAIEDLTKSRCYTWAEIDIRANKLATALKDLGVRKEDRVCVLLTNTIEFCDVFLACQKIGAIMTPLNFRLTPAELEVIFDHASPKVLIFDEKFSNSVNSIKNIGSEINHFVVVGKSNDNVTISYSNLIESGRDTVPEVCFDRSSYAVMMFTAGTTGKPKAVALTNENMLFGALDAIIAYSYTEDDIVLISPPLFHIGAFSWLFTPALYVPMRAILPGIFEPRTTLKIIAEKKVTKSLLIVTMLKMIYSLPDRENYDTSSLKMMGAGGEPCPDVIKEMLGGRVAPGYGLTETCGVGTFLNNKYSPGKPANCIGRLTSSLDLRILNHQNGTMSHVGEGELLLRGPSVVKGYWNMPEKTEERFKNGWFYTGDIVKRDEDGFIYWLGRVDEMIKSGGENIYPAEVEQVIKTHPMVEEVCVIGVPHEKWGTVVKAVVVPRKEQALTEKDLMEFMADKLANFKRPKEIEFVSSLPVKPTAKMPIDKEKVKELYGRIRNQS